MYCRKRFKLRGSDGLIPTNTFVTGNWILDGGLATELERRGVDINHPLWSAKAIADNSKDIFEIHMDYLRSGANIILTATYQASIDGLIKHLNLNLNEAKTIMIFAIELACRAREEFQKASKVKTPVYVGASIGPYGAILADGSEYQGKYDLTKSEVAQYYKDKIELLALPRKNNSADFLAFETLPTANEAMLILGIIEKMPWIRAWFSFSSTDAAKKFAKNMPHPQVLAIGLNCVSPIGLDDTVKNLCASTLVPIVVYPNRGHRYDPSTKKWMAGTSENINWTQLASQWIASGAKVIGGCCGVGPAEIQTIYMSNRDDLPR